MTTADRPTPERGGDDPPRDEHLMAALRHAPDRDIEPPPEVTARILAAARAAVAPPPKPVSTHWTRWASWWSPRVGAAFGTLAVATLVGLMWSTRDLPPTRAPAGVAEAPAAAPAIPASVVTDRLAVPEAGASAVAPTRVEREASRPRVAAAPATSQSQDAAMNAADTRPSAPAAASAQMPRSAPLESAAPSSGPAMAAERRAAADAAVQKAAAAPSARLRQESAAGASLAASVDPLARIDALLAGAAAPGPTWRHAGRTVPHGEAQRQWWAAVAEATRDRWVRAAGPTAPRTPWLVLATGSGEVVSFWFTPDGAFAVQAGGEVWVVPLPPSAQAQWEERVSRW